MDINFEIEGIKTCTFNGVAVNECFAINFGTPDQIICIKAYDERYGEVAMNLENGIILFHLNNDEKVVPLNAELKVRLGG